MLLLGIFGFFWFYKLEGVIALAVCFIYIFEDAIFLCLQFADDEAIFTWCFSSTETSGIDQSVLDFLAAKYVIDLIIYCYCFWQIFGMHLLFFPCSYVGSFVLKGCVADEKVVVCAEIDEMFFTIIMNTTSKISNTIATSMLFDLFSYFGVPVPIKNTSDLF